MINLIPPTAKRSIKIEYWTRVVSVWSILLAIALFASASVLLPAYVLIGAQVAVYETSAAEASQKVADYQNVSVALVDASQQAKLALDELSRPDFSSYLYLFTSLQGETIQLTELRLGRTDAGFEAVTIAGVAADRQALASFRDELRAHERVADVELPIRNLARDRDIAFEIKVTLNDESAI